MADIYPILPTYEESISEIPIVELHIDPKINKDGISYYKQYNNQIINELLLWVDPFKYENYFMQASVNFLVKPKFDNEKVELQIINMD